MKKTLHFSGIAARGPRKGREIIGSGYFACENGKEYIYTKLRDDKKQVFHQIKPGTVQVSENE